MSKAAAVPAESVAETPKKGKGKRLIIIAVAALMVIAAAAAGALFLLRKQPEEAKTAQVKPPVFHNMENFTVNLRDGDRYAQIGVVVQVSDDKAIETLKVHGPVVRSQILLLISSKSAADLTSLEGKKQLVEEIIDEVRRPFKDKAAADAIQDVHFASFVIQ